MTFLSTQMPLVSFIIIVLETLMLTVQCFFLLQRPSDKGRKRYLMLWIDLKY